MVGYGRYTDKLQYYGNEDLEKIVLVYRSVELTKKDCLGNLFDEHSKFT